MYIVIYEKFAYVYKCIYGYAHVLEVSISVCLMVGCRFQFCMLHMAVCYCTCIIICLQ